MKKFAFISCIVFCYSCYSVNRQADVKPIYNEYYLSKFIATSTNQNQTITLHLLDSILSNASSDSLVLHRTTDYLAKFYSNPNSSFRNEGLYDKILKVQVDSKWYTVSEKNIIGRKLYLLHQNDVGSLANDFEFRLPNDEKKTMRSIEAVKLLLFFYNPECDACKQMSSSLKSSKLITEAIAKGQLTILCIYTDNDLSTWYKHLNEYPSQWLQGRDENEYLYKNDVYDLKAIPTIYLLDRNKKVKLKDCTSIEELERNLYSAN